MSPTSNHQADGRPPRLGPQSIELTWALLGVAIALLLGQAIVGVALGRSGLAELALAVATALLAASAVLNARASGILAERRHSEAESFGRLVQALSRSVSPGAVIEAILHELGAAAGADHVAVVQMRPGGAVLDVSFVSMLAGSQSTAGGGAGKDASWGTQSHSSLAGIAGWSGGDDDPRDVVDQIVNRLRDAYGLRNTLAAPLLEGDSIVGAIVLSRRTGEPWTDSTVRLLNSAAGETTAALARVYSFQAAAAEARTDQLTRLPNRRYFDEYCSLVASRRRASDRVAILAVDVDHFKRLNDMYGHQVGDQVLQAISSAIQTSVRDEDLPARYGGEEFMVLLRNPSAGVALEVGERIRQTVRETDLIDAGVTDRVTVSVGVASGYAADEPISEIVERADRALYAAKRTGRDRVVEAWPPEV
ncbi:MAG: sensor domain-containing diguanylate cyclase [Candidatus Limnocylindrales bacterium]